jgi:hypothetical protein
MHPGLKDETNKMRTTHGWLPLRFLVGIKG